MADLSEIQSSQSVKVAGANPSTGAEDSYLDVDTSGRITVKVNDGSGTAIGSVSDSLKVNVTNSFAAGTADKTTFTYGTTIENTVGGVYQDTSPTLTAGQGGAVRLTSYRGIHTNLRDSNGNELLGNTGSTAAIPIVEASDNTYAAAVSGLATALLATDVFVIKGSGTKTINITEISISGTTTAGSGASINCSLIKRSAANTGGTSSTLTDVPHDSNNPAGTATVLAYTVNPTVLGTSVGLLRAFRLNLATTGAASDPLVLDFGTRTNQNIVLRGTSESLSINFNSTSITGSSISIAVEWTEV